MKLFSGMRLVGEADIGIRAKPPTVIIWGNRTFMLDTGNPMVMPRYYFEIDSLHVETIELAGAAPPITPSFRKEGEA